MEKKTKVIGVSATAITATVVVLAALGGQVLGTDTQVSVSVPAGNYSIGDTIQVTIQCAPTRAIKAWELNINFDKTVLEAEAVLEGNIFTGFNTFFNPGIIQNDQGKIIHIYNLIVGPGTVTSPGSFITVRFTAIDGGNSIITLSGVGVTNETMYIPITVINSSVMIYSNFDMNYDGIVDLLDLTNIAGFYGDIGTPGWIRQDINKDGKVSVMDLVLVSVNWGPY